MTKVDSSPFLGKRWKVNSSYTVDYAEIHVSDLPFCVMKLHISQKLIGYLYARLSL